MRDFASLETIGLNLEMNPEFLSSNKENGDFIISIQRPFATSQNQKNQLGTGLERADLWRVLPEQNGKMIKLTDGQPLSRGYWSPRWSPKRNYLAMLSSDGETVNLEIWDKKKEKLRRINKINIENNDPPPYDWVSEEEIVCVLLSEGEISTIINPFSTGMKKAAQAWQKAFQGKESTASILESGVPPQFDKLPQKKLVTINIKTGKIRTLGKAADVQSLSVSPNKDKIAVRILTSERRFDLNSLVTEFDNNMYQVAIVDLKKPSKATLTPTFSDANDVLMRSLQWSPDGKKIAFFQRSSKGVENLLTPFLCTIATSQCLILRDDSLVTGEEAGMLAEFSSFEIFWFNEKELLLYAKNKNSDRFDWFLFKDNGKAKNLTAHLPSPSSSLFKVGDKTFLGLAEGKVWKLDSLKAELLAEQPPIKIASIAWPNGQENIHHISTGSIFWTTENEKKVFYHLDSKSLEWKKINLPFTDPNLLGYSSSKQLSVFYTENDTGTYIGMVDPKGKYTELKRFNTFLSDFESVRVEHIVYQSLQGESLNGFLLFPPGDIPKGGYPTIVFIYPGAVNEAKLRHAHKLNDFSDSFLNFPLLVAKGYAVLLPSMPSGKDKRGPYFELMDGVTPLIDEAIKRGYSNPEKLGLWGQSYGGYAVYGVITQTNRFKAAIASAGLSDLKSLYETFPAYLRYQSRASTIMSWAFKCLETGQINMRVTPITDPEIYKNNSPLTYVSKVQTPLLIIQGDMDYVPIEQGEQFFSSLYRQGKRARFLRYWGEEHVIRGLVNAEDMWKNIYEWFDEFLK